MAQESGGNFGFIYGNGTAYRRTQPYLLARIVFSWDLQMSMGQSWRSVVLPMNRSNPTRTVHAEIEHASRMTDQLAQAASARVAFVDDDADLLAGLRRSLHGLGLGWSTFFYSDPRQALAELLRVPADVVVADIRMPELNGVELAGALAESCPRTVSIVLSGSTDFDLAISSINVGRIFRYLVKPCPTAALVSAVQAALRSRAALESRSTDEDIPAKVAIDLLRSGVIVLGQRGQVLFTNQRAGSLLARRDGIAVENSGICRVDSVEDTRRLHAAIRAARDQGVSDALTVRTQRHGPLRIVVRSRQDDGSTDGPVVCLYLFAEDDESAVDPYLLRRMFGLTASESRLAAALALGLTLEAAADSEGWTHSSAKTYLKNVFSKLGVSRQADLVRLILRNAGR
jgi:DNA-binding NarL/FixJ family response regulator